MAIPGSPGGMVAVSIPQNLGQSKSEIIGGTKTGFSVLQFSVLQFSVLYCTVLYCTY